MASALAETLPFPTFSRMTIDAVTEEICFPACITAPRPVVHEPVEYSAWVLAMACFHMGWTVLMLSGRHWVGMLMLRARFRVSQALHSLTFAWMVAAVNGALSLTAVAIFIWR